MLTDGVQPTTVSFPVQNAPVGVLGPGQVFQSVVQGTGNDLYLQVHGARVPLPAGSDLEPAQAVTVEVVESSQGLQLRIAPQPNTTEPLPDALLAVVARVLEALDLPTTPESAASLLPADLPRTPDSVRALLGVLIGREGTGESLHQLALVLEEAVAAGVLPSSEAAVLADILATNAADLPRILPQLTVGATRSIEAWVSLALAAGNLDEVINALRTDVRAYLSRLREDPAFQDFLQRTGQLRRFENAIDRVLDRLVGTQLQNLRGIGQPYLFLELPWDPDSGVRRARVHVFGEGHGKGAPFDARNVTVAFDVGTTRLGDLWIALRVAHGRCACRFMATSEAAVAALSESSDELVKGLDRAGYPGARVEVALWDGDRMREAHAIIRRFSGINVEA